MNLPDKPLADHHIVTVAGHIGSGKTEVCRRLNQITGWEVVSAGAILRKMAIEHGMSVLEFNEYAKSHANIDRDIDAYISSFRDRVEPVIVDSRLAWHFLPNSLKVFLVVEPAIAAQRVFTATRPDENHASIATAGTEIAERQRIERQRFMQLYSLDCDTWRNYNVVIDTSHALPQEAAAAVLQTMRTGGASPNPQGCWLSPMRLIPTKSVHKLGSEGKFDENARIDVAVYHGWYLILDGHARVSAAIRAGKNLIACNLVAFDSEPLPGNIKLADFVQTSTSLSFLSDWEEAHGFQFTSYPEWLAPKEAGQPTVVES
jgi:cytidylate kinase